jgi:hypothetical protein
VIKKLSFCYNMKSLDTNMLPGNTQLGFTINLPMGMMKLKPKGQDLADFGVDTGANIPNWIDLGPKQIDAANQYHILTFSSNTTAFTGPFPVMDIKATYSYSTKLG